MLIPGLAVKIPSTARPATSGPAAESSVLDCVATIPRDNKLSRSLAHTALHPSPLVVFPSSHVSPLPTMPSPQRTAQTPVLQLWPLAQGMLVKPSPSVVQAWRAVARPGVQSAVAAPGAHSRGVQVPAPVQA